MSDCALCRRPLDDAATVGTTSRHGHPSRRVACLQCSLVQVTPQPTEGELTNFYASHAYRTEHGPVPISVYDPGGIGRRVFRPSDPDYEDGLLMMGDVRAKWACEHAGLVRGMRLLEIGSGSGYTLAALAEHGLICTGVEPDEEEAEKSAARVPPSARVIASAYQDAPLEPPYDVVVSFHVLEHLHDPVGALRDWREMLTPRGALVIEVPNLLKPSLPIDEYHWQHVHLFDFELQTLVGCMVTAGLDPIGVDGSNVNLRVVARPAARKGTYEMTHGGAYVRGYLDSIRQRWAEMGG